MPTRDESAFAELSSRAAAEIRLEEPDLAVTTFVVELRLTVADPTLHRIYAAGIAADSRGLRRLFASVVDDGKTSGTQISQLARAAGTLEKARGRTGSEIRRWSPYAVGDLVTSPAETATWVASTIVTMRRVLAGSMHRAAVPAPSMVPPIPISSLGQTQGREAAQPVTTGTSDERLERVLAKLRSKASPPRPHPALAPQQQRVPDERHASLPTPAGAAGAAEGQGAEGLPLAPGSRVEMPASVPANDRLTEAKADAAAWESRAQRTQGELDALRQHLAEFDQDREALRAEVIRLTSERDELRRVASAAEEQGTTIGLVRKQLLEATSRISEAESRERDAQGQTTTLEAQVHELTHQLNDALGRANEAANEAAAARSRADDLQVRVVELDSAQQAQSTTDASLPSAANVERLVRVASAISRDSGIKAPVAIDVLREILAITPASVPVRERLGEQLLRAGHPDKAVDALEATGLDGLTPVGASVSVEARLRTRQTPSPEIIAMVDWSIGGVSAEMLKAPAWMRPSEAMRLTAELVENPPPEFERWFATLQTTLPPEKLAQLFEVWEEVDEQRAAAALVRWAADGRVSVMEDWVANGLELVGVEAESRGTFIPAFELLLDRARRSRDFALLDRLQERARKRLRIEDWLTIGESIAQTRWHLREGQDSLVGIAGLVRELLATARATNDQARVTSLAALARQLMPDLPESEAVALGDLAEEEQPEPRESSSSPDAVTSVFEALEAAQRRFPGLIVLPEAEKSARQRGNEGVKQARDSLFALGEVAERYGAGELNTGLDEALSKLPGFKSGISAVARQKYRRSYARRLPDGRDCLLGPHLDGGGNGGRIYFAVDEQGRRLIVGHVGRHLPGKNDS